MKVKNLNGTDWKYGSDLVLFCDVSADKKDYERYWWWRVGDRMPDWLYNSEIVGMTGAHDKIGDLCVKIFVDSSNHK